MLGRVENGGRLVGGCEGVKAVEEEGGRVVETSGKVGSSSRGKP